MIIQRVRFILTLTIVCALQVSCTAPPPAQAPAEGATVEVSEQGLRWEDDVAVNPPPPRNLQATVVEEGVQLRWDPPPAVSVPHSYTDTIAYYRVFRRLPGEANPAPLGTAEAPTFLDASPPSGEVFYLVAAVHAGEIEGGQSSEVSVAIGDVDDTRAGPETSGTPSAEEASPPGATDKLAELHVVGGIAGLCDHLVVYADGSGSYFNECSGEQTDFQVESEPFEQLMGMAARFGPFFHSEEDNPDGPDNMLTELALYGQGVSTDQPNQEQQDALLMLLLTILNQGIS